VLRFDTRGHGMSDAPEGEYTLDMMAYDVHGLLQGLGVERCHWVGLSMGDDRADLRAEISRHVREHGAADTTSRYGPRPCRCGRAHQDRANAGHEALVESTLGRWFTGAVPQTHPEVTARGAR